MARGDHAHSTHLPVGEYEGNFDLSYNLPITVGGQLGRFGYCEYQIPIYQLLSHQSKNPLTRFQLLIIIVQVLRRRLRPPTVERLREHVMRTEDSVITALTLIEQIEKRGEHGWIEPLITEMGPWLLLQLGDMANLLEVILK